MKNKLALITGATGFLGRNLCKKLIENNYQIIIIARESSNLDFFEQYKSNIKAIFKINNNNFAIIDNIIAKFRPDITYYLVSAFDKGKTYEEVLNLINTNIIFGTELLRCLVKYDCKNFINIGTYWQHYKNQEYNPVNLYAATKQAFQDIIKYYQEAEQLCSITLKIYDTYGRGDYRNKIINILKKSLKENKELNMSGGEQYLNLIHIDDVIEAILITTQKIYDKNKLYCGKSFFLSSNKLIKLKDLIKLIEKINGKKLNIKLGALSYRKREIMLPYIGEVLPGWYPKIKLEDGLRDFFGSNRENN